MDNEYRLFQDDPQTAVAEPAFLARWQQLIETRWNPNALYASPDWVSHLMATAAVEIRLWTVRDAQRELVGIVPVAKHSHPLYYDIANRRLFKVTLADAEVLGSVPIIPNDERLHADLFREILASWNGCRGVYLGALPTESFCSRFLGDSKSGALDHLRVYSPFGHRPWHLLELRPSFEEYLNGLSPKSRSTLRRKVRLLRRKGNVEARRYTLPDHVPEFMRGASHVSRGSWQARVLGALLEDNDATRRRLIDCAERGLWRSYVLWCGEWACAFVDGYQCRGVFHYATLGFDQAWADFSPGTVLLFLLIEDLHRENPPKIVNFGIGDASYKRRFGTRQCRDETVFVLRGGLRNALAIGTHRGFLGGLETVKRMLGRRVTK